MKSIRAILNSFSASGRALFLLFAGLLVVSSVGLVYLLNQRLLVSVPAHGGTLTEGVIGAPRFVNPILAVSDSDKDLTALVYSGLLKASPEGSYVPDLAESYTVSGDGKTYTATLKPNITFQDGTPITSDDVLFTIQKIQNPTLKSPLRPNWVGVSVNAQDSHTIQFTLSQAYTPFIENLTLGIVPKHIWQNVSDIDFSFDTSSSNPVGSGPFAVRSISRNSSGVPTSYTLTAFKQYALGAPYLDSLEFKFYQNQDDLIRALKDGAIESASGISPKTLTEVLPRANLVRAPQNRVFAVFFNQNQSEILRDPTVRKALIDAVDKNALIQDVLGGYGTPLMGPLPPSLAPTTPDIHTALNADLVAGAKNELLQAGWVVGPDGILKKTTGTGKSSKTITLSFSLATGNVPELRGAAFFVQKAWEKMGAKIDMAIYDQGDLSQNVIRPRKYDALLFGEVIGRTPDLYAFWHSSQRSDPGLNIALYTNTSVNNMIESLRTIGDEATKQTLYRGITAAIQKDAPALFLYTPDFVYAVPKDITGINLGFIESPSDRFLSVALWHRETDSVWPIFASKDK